ncbi:hypothetical protein T440DRAFT_32497 [Plenodomus tracheiphilus IPT5]|uniref:Uncharacterized protein n=1 Tax=Plenodomus tracheiphilus IPT5 TaxID=1408161 RepID=A0A6A7BD35_9PLEO|nr:hypothetical protein T440DRAFT_32497 [Plenodomus tracheiphilus IPT5]
MTASTPSRAPRLRTSEDKLYQACLDACIAGLEKLPVDTRQVFGLTTNNNTDTADCPADTSITPAETVQIAVPPASTALSFASSILQQRPDAIPHSPSPPLEAMNQSKYAGLHGTPPRAPRGPPPRGPQATPPPHLRRPAPPQAQASPALAYNVPAWGAQDARSNLAIQPAADPGSLKLKKKAVKIVGAAAPAPMASTPATAPATTFPPVPAPVTGKPKESESHAPPASNTSTPSIGPASSNFEIPNQNIAAGDSLEDMYARLTTPSAKSTPQATEYVSPNRPDKSTFSFDNCRSEQDVGKKILEDLMAKVPAQAAKSKPDERTKTEVAKEFVKVPQHEQSTSSEVKKSSESSRPLSQDDFESGYMRRAREYVDALPGSKGTTAHTFRFVSKKLRSSYLQENQPSPDANETLKARYVFAVVNYVKGLKKDTPAPTTASVKQMLKDNDGDFLQLCVTLVSQKHIAIDNLNEIVGLCTAVLDVLPKPEPGVAPPVLEAKAQTTTQNTDTASLLKPISMDQVSILNAWPTPEKRDNPSRYRTCVLKGVSGVKSINQLQALVWGGKLESISMPDTSGFGFGMVRFLTPEGCQKYYEATQNGIEIPGTDKDKKTVVLVERTEGPNSTNDVMRACAEGDASRCVRAVGADDEWTDILLMKLGRGKEKVKREVDTIKRGKTARGHNYVEFRFANIYHALGFKRELIADEEWEHCTIGYAADPCEVAHGVHFKDAE